MHIYDAKQLSLFKLFGQHAVYVDRYRERIARANFIVAIDVRRSEPFLGRPAGGGSGASKTLPHERASLPRRDSA